MMEQKAFQSNGKRKILVVEDNPLNQEILADILSDDYDVLTADNGQEGLDLLTRFYNEFSLVLLDVYMPVCNGFEFLEKRRKNELLSSIPVIVITGSEKMDDEIKCLQLGAVDFIIKPFNARIALSRISNIIKLRESEATLSRVEYDELTKLYTMPSFYHHAENCLKTSPDKDYNLILADVTNLNTINHIFGEKKGKDLLCQMSEIFKEKLGTAILARKNECYFALVESRGDINPDAVKQHTSIESARLTIPGAKVKVIIYPKIDKTLPVSLLCDRLMNVMESVKNNYQTNVLLFDEKTQEQIEENQHIELGFQPALEKGEIVACFQPKVDAKTGKIIAAEALARWKDSQGKTVLPYKFIPLLEQNGNIHQLDEYIFRYVCRYQKNRLMAGLKVVPISVNLSRHSVFLNDTLQRYSDIIHEIDVPQELVPLELTESAAAESESIKDIARQFADSGFLLHMDDFGSGYSSLSDLSVLPISVIKLDKSMIDALNNDKGKIIVKYMIRIAHEMNLQVVAEGVEYEAQLNFLKETGCDTIQGYYYYPPQDLQHFNDLLNAPSA